MFRLLLHAMPYRGAERKDFDIFECASAYSSSKAACVTGAIAAAVLVIIPGILLFGYGSFYVISRIILRAVLGGDNRFQYFDSLEADIDATVNYFAGIIPWFIALTALGAVMGYLRQRYVRKLPSFKSHYELEEQGVKRSLLNKYSYHAVFAFFMVPLIAIGGMIIMSRGEGLLMYPPIWVVMGPVFDFLWEWLHNLVLYTSKWLTNPPLVDQALYAFLHSFPQFEDMGIQDVHLQGNVVEVIAPALPDRNRDKIRDTLFKISWIRHLTYSRPGDTDHGSAGTGKRLDANESGD